MRTFQIVTGETIVNDVPMQLVDEVSSDNFVIEPSGAITFWNQVGGNTGEAPRSVFVKAWAQGSWKMMMVKPHE